MRILIILSIIVFSVFGRSYNRTGLNEDTAYVHGLKYDSTVYTKWFELSDKEDISVIVKVDDSSSAGFSSDSVNFMVFYEIADPTYDTGYSESSERKASDVPIVLDTLTTAGLGDRASTYGTEDSLGIIHKATGWLDTTNVPGWAYWRRTFYPQWGVFIRFGFTGLTGHCNTATPMVVDINRRRFIKVHSD